jgi:tetratricopeptide (TPR) repeat protein
MVLSDSYGLPITTRSHEALHWYDQGIRGLLGFRKDTADCFLKALAVDPSLHMARSALGVAYFLEESEEMVAKARDCFTQACQDTAALTDRERDVVETLHAWGQGKGREAVDRMQTAIQTRPREIGLIQRLYFVYFMQGAADKMRDLSASVLHAYDNDPYILGMYSFALEETRDFARALELGQQARALSPDDVWSLHALAHVYYETGAFAAGTRLISEGLRGCDEVGFFRTHIVWHLALFLWEQGRYQQTLALYHEQFTDPAALTPPNFVDAVTLLWRLNLTRCDTPAEWQALRPSLDTLRHTPTYLFNQMHVALGLTGARHFEWALAYLEDLRTRVRPERPGVLGEVGVPLVEGLIAYAKGDYATTVERLSPLTDRIVNIGGSHAQREIFTDILVDACLQAGACDLAVTLLEAKRQHRPERPLALFALERAYAKKGESEQAATVGGQARRLWHATEADANVLAQFGAGN